MKFWPFGKKQLETKPARRSFQAAAFGRLVSSWVSQSTSMDAEIKGSLRAMRDRSRELGRDNDYVKGFFREFVNNIIGQGISFQSQVKKQRGKALDETTNQEIELAWEDWTDKRSCHTGGTLAFQDIERLVARAVAESGEILVRKIRGQKFGESEVRFALEIIESDQLDELELARAQNGNEIRMGVEVDKWQRPVAYHVRTRHPGDFGGAVRPTRIERIPADEILHLGFKERPNQTRSVPLLHATIMRLHHMGKYEESEIVAARASASVMGFIESPDADAIADGTQDGQKVSDFEPGIFKHLAPGEKVNVPDMHRPGGQFEPFMRIMLRAAAAGTGLSYATISKDFSQSNFSSSRMDMINERDNWRILQQWFIRNFHAEVFREWLDMAVLSGVLNLPSYEIQTTRYRKVKWMPRGWAWIDPVKEVTAAKEAILGGLSTISTELSRQGEDVDEVFAQRAREIDLAKTHNLILDTDFANDLKKAPKGSPQAADAPPGNN
ncbi:MAG: phage portal protein [Bdellovibrionales bacterium]